MKRLFTATLLFIIMFTGCTDGFDTLNVNPNQAQAVPPNMVMTQVIFNVADRSPRIAYGQGNFITQHTAKQNFTDFDRYAWTPSDGYWNTLYAYLRDINNLILLGEQTGNTNYQGIGYIWKAYTFSLLTDALGDVPYSSALQGRDDANYQPVYDTQEAVYTGILNDLKRANELLNPDGFMIEGDIFYDGDIMQWKKMANSLRLRYLLRISNASDVSSEMREILNNPAQFPIFQSLDDQAALTYLDSPPNQWFSHSGRVGGFRERRMSQTIEDRFMEFNDPRIREYFRPTRAFQLGQWDKEFNGFPNGLGEAEALDWDGGSNFQSELAEKYFDEPNSAEAIVMTYFELQFILAEASLKGLIPGNPANYYTEGVRSAMEYYNVEAERIDEYLSQPSVAYNPDNALEQIMMQKWIGSYMIAFEGWNDWRRTGLPSFMPAVSDDNNNRIPVRFLYPTNERVFNPDNIQQAISRQGADNINTPIWWMGSFNPAQ